MRITFYIERKGSYRKCDEYSHVTRPNNLQYLSKDDIESFPILTEVMPYDENAFNSRDMPQLIKELEMIMNQLDDQEDIKHLKEVIELARACQIDENLVLIATPFGDHYE